MKARVEVSLGESSTEGRILVDGHDVTKVCRSVRVRGDVDRITEVELVCIPAKLQFAGLAELKVLFEGHEQNEARDQAHVAKARERLEREAS